MTTTNHHHLLTMKCLILVQISPHQINKIKHSPLKTDFLKHQFSNSCKLLNFNSMQSNFEILDSRTMFVNLQCLFLEKDTKCSINYTLCLGIEQDLFLFLKLSVRNLMIRSHISKRRNLKLVAQSCWRMKVKNCEKRFVWK